MGEIVQRAAIRHQAMRASIEVRYPFLFPPAIDRTAIVLGRNERGAPLFLPLRARLEHSHVIGTTGGGKTKLLEHMIRQDIIDGRGVCVFDPHGNHPDSLYRSLLSWLDWRGLTKTRTIHIIDPNNTTHVTGFDPLALPDAGYDPTVIAEALLEAIERLWGEENSDTKPTLQRVLVALVTALCDLGLTLAEARFLFDPDDRYGIRAWAIKHLEDQEASEELQWLHSIATEPRGAAQFRLEIVGPRNRLSKLTRLIALRTMVGQQDRTIDFRAALDDGHVVLVNLSGGPRVSDKSAQVLGRILTRMIFFHAQRRLHPERPFFFYLDECQLYLSGDVSRLLSECRKYGLGCVLSHQYLAQFESSGLELLEAVKNTTNCKIVLRIKDLTEAADLADMVLPYDLEMPVRALIKPTVVGHRIRLMKGANASQQISNSMTRTDTMGRSATVGRARTVGTAHSTTRSESQSVSEGVSTTEGSSLTEGASESEGTSASEGVNATRGTSQSSTSGQGRSVGWSAQGSVGGGDGGFRDWTDTTETPTLNAVSYSEGADTNSSRADGSSESQGTSASRGTSSARGRSSAHTSSRAETLSTSRSKTTGVSRGVTASIAATESVSEGESSSRATGTGETRGNSRGESLQESLEPIYENLPGSVHSLENVRYMAAQVLRNLTTGRAAVNFVGADGMKTASLRVANVESYALPEEQFEELRARVLDASPSASPIDQAREHVAERQRKLIEAAGQDRIGVEPETAAGFRTKKMRVVKS